METGKKECKGENGRGDREGARNRTEREGARDGIGQRGMNGRRHTQKNSVLTKVGFKSHSVW